MMIIKMDNHIDIKKCNLVHGNGRIDSVIINGNVYLTERPYTHYVAENEADMNREEFAYINEFEEFKRANPEGWKFFSQVYMTEEEILKDEFYINELENHPELLQNGKREPIVANGIEYFPLNADLSLYTTLIKETYHYLLPISLGGKWGYVDVSTGKVAILPKWDWAAPFSRGYAMVRMGCPGKAGAIEPKHPGFYCDDDFDEDGQTDDVNWGWEYTEDSRCGYINTAGEIVIPLNYADGDWNLPFNASFVVRKPGAGFGIIDKHENVIADFIWSGIGNIFHMAWGSYVAYRNPFHWYDDKGTWNGVYGRLIPYGHRSENASFYSENGAVSYYSELNIECPDTKYAVLADNGMMIVDDLDISPMRRRREKDEDKRQYHLIVCRNGKYGLIKDCILFLEPDFTIVEVENHIHIGLSIYEKIIANIDENGRMPSEFNLGVKIINGREIRFAPGMLDGSMIYHSHRTFCKISGKPLAPEKEADVIAALLMNFFDSSDTKILEKVEDVLSDAKNGAWAIAEDILGFIWREGDKRGDANGDDCWESMLDSWFHSCLHIIKTTNNVNLLKISLTMLGYLGVMDLEKSVSLLATLAAYEDFTYYALIAILCLHKFIDSNSLIFNIAKRVGDWGLVHAIERLEPENDEIRKWILLNGCIDVPPKLYLALTCAEKGDLISTLRQETLDDDLFDSISNVIEALLNEEPMPGISVYEHAVEAITLYLRHAESRPHSEISNRIKDEIHKQMAPTGDDGDEA